MTKSTSTTDNAPTVPAITDLVNQVASEGSVQDWDQVLALITATGELVGQLPFASRYDELEAINLVANLTTALPTHRPK